MLIIVVHSHHLHTEGFPKMSISCCVCWAVATEVCAECRSAHYCSKACQEDDQKTHKILCQAFKEMPERPSPLHRRAIVFPVDQEDPLLVWISLNDRGGFDSDVCFGEDTAPIQYLGFETSPAQTSRYARSVSIWWSEDCSSREPNRSCFKVVDGEHKHWRGHLMAVRHNHRDLRWNRSRYYGDIDLSDFRQIVCVLRTHPNRDAHYPLFVPRPVV